MSISSQNLPDTPPQSDDGIGSAILRFLRIYKRLRIPFLLLFFIFIIGCIGGLIYLCWLWWLPIVFHWGFEEASWRTVFAGFGVIYLAAGPFAPAFLFEFFGKVANLYLKEEEERSLAALKKIDSDQTEIERQLEQSDASGLVSLIRYSRLQLEAYYRIGLDQTQRSFRYSVISMWLGFGIIMIGISTFFLPAPFRQYIEGADVKSIPILGGVVIELISALFLWIYKSSISQLTYFYNRQLDNHNVLICSRIAGSMKSPDKAKTIIITKFMEFGQKAQSANAAQSRASKLSGKKSRARAADGD